MLNASQKNKNKGYVNLCKNNCIVYDSLYMLIKILLFKTKKNEFYPYNDYQI